MMCILLGAPILQPLIGWILKLQQTPGAQGISTNFTIHDYHIAFAVFPLGLILALIALSYIHDKTKQH